MATAVENENEQDCYCKGWSSLVSVGCTVGPILVLFASCAACLQSCKVGAGWGARRRAERARPHLRIGQTHSLNLQRTFPAPLPHPGKLL